jgi:hypothetical protein
MTKKSAEVMTMAAREPATLRRKRPGVAGS